MTITRDNDSNDGENGHDCGKGHCKDGDEDDRNNEDDRDNDRNDHNEGGCSNASTDGLPCNGGDNKHEEESRSRGKDRRWPRYAQDFAAGLARKHMHYICLAHERMAFGHVDVAETLEADVDRLHEGARAYVTRTRTTTGRATMAVYCRVVLYEIMQITCMSTSNCIHSCNCETHMNVSTCVSEYS